MPFPLETADDELATLTMCRKREPEYEDMMLMLVDLTESLKEQNTADWFTGCLRPGCQSDPD